MQSMHWQQHYGMELSYTEVPMQKSSVTLGDIENSSERSHCEIFLGCHFTLLPELRAHTLEGKGFSMMLVQQ